MSKLNLSNIAVIILAAGKGTRLNCLDKPKVMLEIGGKPIVSYVVATLKTIGFTPEQICLVAGFHAEKVKEYFGENVSYALQTEQKGTAQAAYIGMSVLPKIYDQILVLNGDDSAFLKPQTLINFIEQHLNSGVVASLLSVELEYPELYGRVVRGQDGRPVIVEKEDLTEEQKKIKETSTGVYCFKRAWFEEIFPNLSPLRGLKEYGINTTFAVAAKDSSPVQVVKLANSEEWLGINTPEELAEANKRILNLKK